MSAALRRVALVTCAELPGADPDTRRLIEPLRAGGIEAIPCVWDDARIDWTTFDLAIVRSCWDYAGRREEFLRWAERVPRLANPAEVLQWNTDKRYLAELARAGIGVVPTDWVGPGDSWKIPEDSGELSYVIKPAVSLCALDTGRYDLADRHERQLARAHMVRLQDAGRVAMVQPYLSQVESNGESSLVFIAGRFSHAMRKGPALDGPDRGEDRRFAPGGGVDLSRRDPTEAELGVAQRTLELVPGGRDQLLYARVDLVPSNDGVPLVMEVELTEPNLFLDAAPHALPWFVSAIVGLVETPLHSWRGVGVR